MDEPKTVVDDMTPQEREGFRSGVNPDQRPKLKAVTLTELLTYEFPAREQVLSPIIQTQSINMLFSKRGVGKTNMSLGIGFAVASASSFLRWKALKARRVVYVDGEMPGVVMQERIAALVAANDVDIDPSYFRLITPDLQEQGMPSLSGTIGQGMVEEHLAGDDLLILDNISTLCRGGKENEAESWLPVQEWILSLRRLGISVLLDHHAGKNGAQRGTSRREDVLDTIIVLRHPSDYAPDQGARFEVHFEKSRGIFGKDVEPFEAQMRTDQGKVSWLMRDIEDVMESRAREMFADGMTVRDVADELKVSRSAAGRLKKKVGGSL